MKTKRIGYWMNEKKCKKFIKPEFVQLCRSAGLELVQIDLHRPLEEQGPFSAILHKITDHIIKADGGNEEACRIVRAFEDYLSKHPEVVVIDPLDSVRKLIDRSHTYSLINHSQLDGVFIPSFVELSTTNHEENVALLRKAGIKFPFVCKPTVGDGCKLAHEMAIIFNEEGVRDITPPCVAMDFVNHNALMFKIFVVAENWNVVDRPSLKNFHPSSDQKTIFFDSQDISKAKSDCFLTRLDEEDKFLPLAKPSMEVLGNISATIRRDLGMDLFGVDVVVENSTGRYAIVDINSFPGYDGVPGIYEMLRDCILKGIEAMNNPASSSSCCSSPDNSSTSEANSSVIISRSWTPPSCDDVIKRDQKISSSSKKTRTNNIEEDSGIETADSSDEKTKHNKKSVLNNNNNNKANVNANKRVQAKYGSGAAATNSIASSTVHQQSSLESNNAHSSSTIN